MAFWYAIYLLRLIELTIIARFNILSAVVVGLTALTCLLSPGVDASMAGFALAFASSIQQGLLFVVRRFVQLEQSMVALERINEYVEQIPTLSTS
jgi:hypothetical protein